MKRIDLHTHSRYSDGTSTPAEIVRLAHKKGVLALVLSDHDSISGYGEAAAEGERVGLRVFCGLEINTREDDQVHILGYRIDPASPVLAERLEEFRGRRKKRVSRIVGKLRDLGLDILEEEVFGISMHALGRPHIADALRRKRIVDTRQEAFKKYLMKGAPAYVEPMGPSVQEAIEVIKAAGGWASLAHPGLIKKPQDLERWVGFGLQGLEVYYPAHSKAQRERLRGTAKDFGLIPTGGSDYHGPGTGKDDIGCIEVPDDVFEELTARLAHEKV